MQAKRIGHITQDTMNGLVSEIELLYAHSIPNFGKQVVNLGATYSYSGKTIQKTDWSLAPSIKALMEKINKSLGLDFNSALINWYPKGKPVGISAHQDIESCLHRIGIVSVSLGINSNCNFIFRDKRTKAIVSQHELKHGDVFFFDDEMNTTCTHEIPKVIFPNGRVSITFRKFKEQFL